jgi:hypothetical protein
MIEATLTVNIEHRSGPVIDDPDHVRRWLCDDGATIHGVRGGFLFEVCPEHADPDECDFFGTVAIYFASIASVFGSGT